MARLGTDDFGSQAPRALVLVETTPGQNALDGVARLGTDPRNPQTYSAGAVLLNGARLAAIYPDYVVLERNGETARLYAQGEQSHRGARTSDLLRVGGRRETSTISHQAPSDLGRIAPPITDFIRPNPVFDGPVLKGFALYPGHRSAVFSSTGLRAGDVLVALNGIPANATEQVMDLLQQWVSGAAIDATVQRDGQTEHITLDGSLIHPE